MVGNKKKYYRIHVLFTVYILISEITLKASQPLLGVKGLPTGNFLFLSLGGARQIQDPENMGSKKTTIFLVFLGVLQEFSRKANEDGAGRRQKTNAGGGTAAADPENTGEKNGRSNFFGLQPSRKTNAGGGGFPKNECRGVGWRRQRRRQILKKQRKKTKKSKKEKYNISEIKI